MDDRAGRRHKMEDRGFTMFLAACIGLGGVAILVLGMTGSMFPSEKALTIAVGGIGLVWAFTRVLTLRPDLICREKRLSRKE